LSVKGKPGEWVKAEKGIESMDMQCRVRADRKPVLMYLDEVSLTVLDDP